MFKANNKDTRRTTVNFGKVNVDWVEDSLFLFLSKMEIFAKMING